MRAFCSGVSACSQECMQICQVQERAVVCRNVHMIRTHNLTPYPHGSQMGFDSPVESIARITAGTGAGAFKRTKNETMLSKRDSEQDSSKNIVQIATRNHGYNG